MRRHDDDVDLRRPLTQPSEQLEPRHFRHTHVGDDDGRRDLVQRTHGPLGVLRHLWLVAEHAELSLEAFTDGAVVIDDEDAVRHATESGSETTKAAPRNPSTAD